MTTPIDVWLIVYDSTCRVVANSNRKDVKHKVSVIFSEHAGVMLTIRAPLITEQIGFISTFRLILMNIFDLCDLDNSGSLSREEFNLYNLRTGDEEVTDTEWELLQEHFKISKGELNLRDFLTLHQMEAEDCNGDTEDMWLSLESIGCNHKLQLDEVKLDSNRIGISLSIYKIWPFVITIRSIKPIAGIKPERIQPMSKAEWNSLACYFSEQPLITVAESANCRLFAFKTHGFLVLLLHASQPFTI
ncbi:hypothetical protein TTRE_0000060901 [Trichuris trichiura]|uniref:EF-hand domain-containing protein n=1 Tax=Trichuris trichiura TaxID=36087 RepID=A0A077Z171_TRITR|nr:hypothetical protein TTRE_0000060901 [Trichuris trichiura]